LKQPETFLSRSTTPGQTYMASGKDSRASTIS
jgi:hypothetical protein